MAKTTNKRSHDNNESRLTAKERRDAYFTWMIGPFLEVPLKRRTIADRAYVLKMLEAHARATLDRAKRRMQQRHVKWAAEMARRAK